MIDYHTRVRENDNLPLWCAPAITEEKAAIFNVLITCQIMQSKDAQCNTCTKE